MYNTQTKKQQHQQQLKGVVNFTVKYCTLTMYHHHRRRHYYQWYHRLLRVVVAAVVVELFICHHLDHNSCCGFCFNTHCNKIVATTGTSSFSSTLLSDTHNSKNSNNNNSDDDDNNNDVNHVHDDEWQSFSIPLTVERPQPTSVFDTWNRLWNDPRPVSSLIQDAIKSNSNSNNDEENSTIPYCLLSEEFLVPAVSDDDDLDDDHKQHRFQISVFPRGRFATSSASSKANTGQSSGVYLKYIPDKYGDEVDVLWKLTLVDTADTTIKLLPILTSGGLPKSDTTFTCGMTFCVENEDIESCGRCADWGASTWYQEDVCDAVSIPNTLEAHVQMKICGSRSGESSFRFRNFNNNNNNNNNKEGGGKFKLKGALGAVYYSQIDAGTVLLDNNNKIKQSREIGEGRRTRRERSFRVGEVIVPMAGHENEKILENTYLVTAGTDYRIMTMTDQYGRSIFSTKDVPKEERKYVKLALRPCGWKQLQRQQRQNKNNSDTPITVTDWPVEVDAGLLSSSALSRFNIAATAVPRFVSTFRRDQTAVLLGIALALLPLPGALIGRNYVSLYAIPSASMDPTLIKGDVLLVEKFPHVYDRTNRGDIVLFRPPSALTDIIGTINRNSLFVKRVVGIPGDTDISLDLQTKEVTINSNSNNNNDNRPAVGPDRDLCDDEPLKLIDKFLENGKGKYIKSLDTNEVYVLGDCKSVSIDSRVFGTLPTDNIQGKPIMRIWPPSRITIKKL